VLDWLFEGRLTVYLILVGVGSIALALWARSGFVLVREAADRRKGGKNKPAWPVLIYGVIGVLALLYFLMDRLVETPGEQIARKLQDMARAVKARNVDAIFEHVSDQFHAEGMDKEQFRGYANRAIEKGWIDELFIDDLSFPGGPGEVNFRARPRSGRLPERIFLMVRSQFVLDPDGQWRLKSFQAFFGNDPLPLPAL
jgi:hypothetical protein